MYFSWTDIDEIHGDQFLKENIKETTHSGLISPSELVLNSEINNLVLIEIAEKPFYWINRAILFNALRREEGWNHQRRSYCEANKHKLQRTNS